MSEELGERIKHARKPADPPRVRRLWRVVENERRVEEI